MADMPAYHTECLACGSTMDPIEPLGLAMEGGNATCPSCGEHHTYRILDDVLTIRRTSVPAGYTGPVEKTYHPGT